MKIVALNKIFRQALFKHPLQFPFFYIACLSKFEVLLLKMENSTLAVSTEFSKCEHVNSVPSDFHHAL